MVFKHPKSNNWYYKFKWNGRLVRKSTKQANKRVAEQLEAAARTALAKGEHGIVDRKPVPIFREFAQKFVDTVETQNRRKTADFYQSKLTALLNHKPFLSARLDHIDEEMIDAFKNKRLQQGSRRKDPETGKPMPLAIATVNRELATLRRMLRIAHEWGIIQRVPKIKLLPGERTREFTLSHEQEQAYLAACPQPLHDVALLLLDTGLRVREALTLRWEEVHLRPANGARFGYLTVLPEFSKNSKLRHVPLSERVREMLFQRKGQAKQTVVAYVFTRWYYGRELSQTWLDQQHKKVRENLGLGSEFVLHSLRHTFGTRLGESGAEAFTIMKLMGHSTVTISQRYVHPSPESVELAFERLQALNQEKREGVLLRGLPKTEEPTVPRQLIDNNSMPGWRNRQTQRT